MPTEAQVDPRTAEVLVQSGKDGDANAIAELFHRFYPLLAATLRNLQLSPDEGEDAAQEMARQFLELVREFSSEREIAFAGYLKAKLRLRVANYLRAERLRRSRSVPLLDADDALVVEPAVEISFPEGAPHPRLHRALKRLSPKQRAVIAGYYWQERKTRQIAQELGLTTQATTALRRRAEATLRTHLLVADDDE